MANRPTTAELLASVGRSSSPPDVNCTARRIEPAGHFLYWSKASNGPVCGVEPLAMAAMGETPMAAINLRCLPEADLATLVRKPFDGASL